MKKIGIESIDITKDTRAIYTYDAEGKLKLAMIVKLHKDYHEMFTPDLRYIGRSY